MNTLDIPEFDFNACLEKIANYASEQRKLHMTEVNLADFKEKVNDLLNENKEEFEYVYYTENYLGVKFKNGIEIQVEQLLSITQEDHFSIRLFQEIKPENNKPVYYGDEDLISIEPKFPVSRYLDDQTYICKYTDDLFKFFKQIYDRLKRESWWKEW